MYGNLLSFVSLRVQVGWISLLQETFVVNKYYALFFHRIVPHARIVGFFGTIPSGEMGE
jgi:hypothetical protein